MRFIGVTTLCALLAGCYTLQPTRGVTPVVGTEMAFDINDAGRVALGGSMGPEIGQIEGRLIGNQDGEYIVSVHSVKLLRGGDQVWSGEQVRIKPEHVAYAYERRFSPGRSIALGAIGIGGFTAFFITRSLIASGNGETGEPPCCITQLILRP